MSTSDKSRFMYDDDDEIEITSTPDKETEQAEDDQPETKSR